MFKKGRRPKESGMSIYTELGKDNINWENVEKIIKSYGSGINDFDGDFTPLSEIIYDYADSGREDMLIKVIDLFFQNGFDVQGNNGHNGVSCLYYLILRCDDGTLTTILEKFLDAGTDTKVDMYDDEFSNGIISDICSVLGQWTRGDYERANLFEAAYQMVEAYEENRPYKGIRTVNDCFGRTVRKIEKISLSKDDVSNDISGNDSSAGALIVWADDLPLIISRDVSFVVNPYIPDMAVNRLDISEYLHEIIGAKIVKAEFVSPYSAWLLFDNGRRLRILSNREWGNENDSKAYFKIVGEDNICPIGSGNVINRIYLKRGIHWSETIKNYSEPTMLITTGTKAYQIYVRMYLDGKKALIFDEIPHELIGTASRWIDEENLFVGAVMQNDNNQAVMVHLLNGDNGHIIIVPDDYHEDDSHVKVRFCKIEVNQEGEEVNVPIRFIDESEWGKQEFPHPITEAAEGTCEEDNLIDREISESMDNQDEDVDLTDNKEDERPPWNLCASANIVKTRVDKDGVVRHGTKEFAGGAKVYLCGKFWREGDKEIKVIGLDRNHRYAAEWIPVEYIENIRLQTVFKPAVVDMMNYFEYYDEWWHRTGEDKREIKRFINAWNKDAERRRRKETDFDKNKSQKTTMISNAPAVTENIGELKEGIRKKLNKWKEEIRQIRRSR